jgi:hypothetical protein
MLPSVEGSYVLVEA